MSIITFHSFPRPLRTSSQILPHHNHTCIQCSPEWYCSTPEWSIHGKSPESQPVSISLPLFWREWTILYGMLVPILWFPLSNDYSLWIGLYTSTLFPSTSWWKRPISPPWNSLLFPSSLPYLLSLTLHEQVYLLILFYYAFIESVNIDLSIELTFISPFLLSIEVLSDHCLVFVEINEEQSLAFCAHAFLVKFDIPVMESAILSDLAHSSRRLMTLSALGTLRWSEWRVLSPFLSIEIAQVHLLYFTHTSGCKLKCPMQRIL